MKNASFYKTTVVGVQASNTAEWTTDYFDGEENFIVKFSSCNNLWSRYDGGISRASKTKNTGSKTKKVPTIFPSLYSKNVALDKDKDGLVCER